MGMQRRDSRSLHKTIPRRTTNIWRDVIRTHGRATPSLQLTPKRRTSVRVSSDILRLNTITLARQLISEGWCKLVKISTKDQVADIATKILSSTITEYFSKTVLGIYNTDTDAVYVTVDVDQSLHVFEPYCVMSYNDWGVMSTPHSVVVLNNTVVVLNSMYGTVVPNSSMYDTV